MHGWLFLGQSLRYVCMYYKAVQEFIDKCKIIYQGTEITHNTQKIYTSFNRLVVAKTSLATLSS